MVVCLPAAHYVMLSKPLLYTAMSRAQKLLVLVGDKKVSGLWCLLSDVSMLAVCLMLPGVLTHAGLSLVLPLQGLMLSLRKNSTPVRYSLLSDRLARAVTTAEMTGTVPDISNSNYKSGARPDSAEFLKKYYVELGLDDALLALVAKGSASTNERL